MSDDHRNDLPPLAAGSDRPGSDPDAPAFDPRPAESPAPPIAGRPESSPPATRDEEAGKKTTEEPEPGTAAEERRVFVGTGLFWGLIVGVILAVLVVFFAAQNTQDSTVKLFAWDWSSPLFVVILISLIVGIVLDEIVGLVYRSRKRRRLAEKEELKRLRGNT